MTISGSAFTYGGNYIRLHIHHNGERLDESWYAGADIMTEFYDDDDEITKCEGGCQEQQMGTAVSPPMTRALAHWSLYKHSRKPY